MPKCPSCGRKFQAVGNLTTHRKTNCTAISAVNQQIIGKHREMKRKKAVEEELAEEEIPEASTSAEVFVQSEPEPEPEPANEEP
ncbi:hypothetical protein V5O48_012723, partial [Marasmius crinis-equi]